MPKKSSQKPPAQLSLPKKATRIKPLRSTGNGASPKPGNTNTKGNTTQLYVRFPPSERWHMEDVPELPNGFIAETDIPLETRLDLQAREIQFRDGEPIGGLRLFEACIEAGYFPPISVLKKFRSAIWKYLSGEAKNLDEAFGIKPTTRSRGYPFKKAQQERDAFLCGSMYMLRCEFHLSIPEAAQMVYERYKARAWKIGSNCIKMLTRSDLQKRYSVEWKKFRKRYDGMSETFKINSKKEKQEILSRFPYSSLPAKLQKEHPGHLKQISPN
jgi:hypothetical protein